MRMLRAADALQLYLAPAECVYGACLSTLNASVPGKAVQ